MGESGIGRLLVASLHQAITEELPGRLSFYEPWLTSDGLTTSRVSLAGVRAAFSFLRQEEGAYESVVGRAGGLAADWVWSGFSTPRRMWLQALPAWARRRAACRLAKRLAEDAWRETRARVRWRRGVGRLRIAASLFCDVRTPVPSPLCQFYAAALARFMQHLAVESEVGIEACRAVGDDRCEIAVARPAAGSVARGVVAAAVVWLASGLFPGVATASAQAVRSAPPGTSLVLVVPFENASRDPRLSWLGEGAALLMTDRLRAAGIDAMSRDERLRLFERLQVPPLANLSRATVIRLGRIVGARWVVTGRLTRDGDAVVVHTRRITLETGVMEPEAVERAGASDLLAAFDRLAARVGGTAPAASAGEAPLAAFEQYVKGLLAETPASQTVFLRAALAANPKYYAARLALWQVQTIAGDHRAAIETVRAVPEDSLLFADAQFQLALSLLHLGQSADAAAVLKALHERAPSAVLLNNIGIAVVREPALAARIGRATWFFSQARALDTLDPDYVVNLGYAYWVEGDPSGAAYWLREGVRLDPAEASAHALLAQALFASGQAAEAYRELSLAQRLSSAYDAVELKTGAAAPRGFERLKDVLVSASARRIDVELESGGARDQKEQAAFYLDRGRRFAGLELDVAAEADLTRALYFSPYNAEAHLLLAKVYLRSGRLRESIGAVKISLWSEESAAAHLVLAEAYLESGDLAVARSEAERALVLDPNSVHARKLLERLPK